MTARSEGTNTSVTQSGPEALAAAVRANDVGQVRAVLERFPNMVTQLDDALPGEAFGATALLVAVQQNNRDMVDVLLQAGANINQRSHWWAGSFGVLDHDGELADFLIERGARIDAHAAARLADLDILRELVSKDPALVHGRGGDGQLPLHFAASVEVAEFLVAHGADIDAQDVDHESTAAQWMIRDRQDVARYLVGRGCRTDILLAAALGDALLVEQHLAADANAVRAVVSEEFFPKQNPRSGGTIYNWTLGTGKGPQVIAREFGHDQVFRLLMDRSPAPLQLTVWCGLADADEVAAIVGRHPDIGQTLGPAERRKLPDAARDENAAGVRLMLDAGWPIDARGQHGATALHWAAFHGDLEVARELLRRDASLELLDDDFKGTPLFWGIYGSVHGWRASTGNYPAVVEALLAAGATPPPVTGDLRASDAVRDVLRRRAPG